MLAIIAARTLARRDPSFDLTSRLSATSRECATLLKSGSIASLAEAGDDRVPYACGTVLALVAEAASAG